MNRVINCIIALILLTSISLGKTIEIPVSQIAAISPGVHNQDLSFGPRLCLKFNMPEELRGIELGFAELIIHQFLPIQSNDSLAVFEVFAMSSSWNEGYRWNDFLVFGGAIDSNQYATYTQRCGADSAVSMDITQMAQNWNDYRDINFGVLLIPRTTNWQALREYNPDIGRLRGSIILKITIPGNIE